MCIRDSGSTPIEALVDTGSDFDSINAEFSQRLSLGCESRRPFISREKNQRTFNVTGYTSGMNSSSATTATWEIELRGTSVWGGPQKRIKYECKFQEFSGLCDMIILGCPFLQNFTGFEWQDDCVWVGNLWVETIPMKAIPSGEYALQGTQMTGDDLGVRGQICRTQVIPEGPSDVLIDVCSVSYTHLTLPTICSV